MILIKLNYSIYRIDYRRDMYKSLNRTRSRIVRVEAASWLAQEFRMVLPVVQTELRMERAWSIRAYTVNNNENDR